MAEQRAARSCLILVLAITSSGCPGHTVVPSLPKGGLSITVDPEDARVYVDGQLVGTSVTYAGSHIPLHPGHHRVKLVADRWFDEYIEIETGDEVLSLAVEMTAVPEPLGADPP